MSLQEAASSGSFKPHAAPPSDPQPAESPFDPPMADGDIDQAMPDSASPFGPAYETYEYSPEADENLVDAGGPDMRATRRRAWTVVGLAIVIPAAVAGIIAWQLFGSDAQPAPTVTRVTTTPAVTATPQTPAATAAPVQATVAATTETPASATVAAAPTTAVSTSAEPASAAASDGQAAVAATPEADLSSLEPAARLAAWTEIESIQVLPGETLWLIAQNYGTTISAIVALNAITDPETLSIGQQLMIPVGFAAEIVETAAAVTDESGTAASGDSTVAITVAAADAPPVAQDLMNWHTIAPVLIEEGDSLAAIAFANNTSVEAIVALNGLTNPDVIFVGTEVQVPIGYQGYVAPSVVGTAPAGQDSMSDNGATATSVQVTDSMSDDTPATDEEDSLDP